MYVLNKGLCLGAFILLTFNFALGPARNLGLSVSSAWLDARQAFGMSGFLFVLMHAVISFLIFSPPVYGKPMGP